MSRGETGIGRDEFGRMTSAKGPRRGRAILELESFLPYRVAALAQRLSREIEEGQRRHHKLAVKDWKLMQVMARHGRLAPADIRRMGTQDKATISRAIKCLLDRGLVAKHPQAGDSRTFDVAFTEAGWAVYESIVPKVRRKQEEVLAALTAGESKQLKRLLDKLDTALARPRVKTRGTP